MCWEEIIKGGPKFGHLCNSLKGALSAGKGGQVWFTGVTEDYCYSSSGGGDNNMAPIIQLSFPRLGINLFPSTLPHPLIIILYGTFSLVMTNI